MFCCDDLVVIFGLRNFLFILLVILDFRVATYFNFYRNLAWAFSSFLCYLDEYKTLERFPWKLIVLYPKTFAYPLPTFLNWLKLCISLFIGEKHNFSHFYSILLLRHICFNVLHVCSCTMFLPNSRRTSCNDCFCSFFSIPAPPAHPRLNLVYYCLWCSIAIYVSIQVVFLVLWNANLPRPQCVCL